MIDLFFYLSGVKHEIEKLPNKIKIGNVEVEVDYKKIPENIRGYCEAYKIVINKTKTPDIQIKTLTHELIHLYLAYNYPEKNSETFVRDLEDEYEKFNFKSTRISE